MKLWGWILLTASILWTGVMAGFFWSFSNTVMPGLSVADELAAMASMQGINIVVKNPIFFIGFFGAPLLCVLLVLYHFIWGKGFTKWLLIAGGVIYILGTFFVTTTFNLPLNNALAVVNPTLPENAQIMVAYIQEWIMWNHVRTFSSMTAFVLFTLSLVLRSRNPDARLSAY